ncbi:MAG TPA: hypothetical protein VF921_02790 [Vicinamibacterales bacterium]
MIGRRGRAKDLGENRLERIGPRLVARKGGVQLVGVHHAVEQPSVLVGELVVHIDVAHPRAVGEPGEVGVDGLDLRENSQVVIAGKDAGQDNRRRRRFPPNGVNDPRKAAGDRRNLRVAARPRPDVVRAGQDHDDLRVDAVQLSVLEPPEHVLNLVRAPAEVRGIPAEEIRLPVREVGRIVDRAPAAHDRVADEIDVDAALLRFVEQLRMGGE